MKVKRGEIPDGVWVLSCSTSLMRFLQVAQSGPSRPGPFDRILREDNTGRRIDLSSPNRHIRRKLKEKDTPIVLTNTIGSGIHRPNDLSLFTFLFFHARSAPAK